MRLPIIAFLVSQWLLATTQDAQTGSYQVTNEDEESPNARRMGVFKYVEPNSENRISNSKDEDEDVPSPEVGGLEGDDEDSVETEAEYDVKPSKMKRVKPSKIKRIGKGLRSGLKATGRAIKKGTGRGLRYTGRGLSYLGSAASKRGSSLAQGGRG